MSGLFITGTDTGVGKTHVTAALLAALRARGATACAFKPIQTGCRPSADGALTAPDLDLCLRAARWAPSIALQQQLCPHRFPLAASPHLAAAAVGTDLTLAALVDAFAAVHRAFEPVLVEGAGGLLVPLNAAETMADLAAALALPVLVVARPGLGTLNHTLLTCAELRRRALPLAAVVLSQRPGDVWGEIEEDNLAVLRARLEGRVVRFPPLPDEPDASWIGAGEALRRFLAQGGGRPWGD